MVNAASPQRSCLNRLPSRATPYLVPAAGATISATALARASRQRRWPTLIPSRRRAAALGEDPVARRAPAISKRENEMTAKGKVLVLVSSGHGLPLKDGKVYAGAGYYLNELTVPVRALMKEGYEITFANPKGNTPQMDVHSAVPDFFGGDEARLQDYLKFRDTLTGLKNPTRISDVIASGLDQYDAVFVPGGHGPMMDLLDDPDAGTVMRHFHNTSKPMAVLCHGPISLLSALSNSTEVVRALAAGDDAGARERLKGGFMLDIR